MSTGQTPTETNGPVDSRSVDYGVVETKIGQMNWPERGNIQKEIWDSWSRVNIGVMRKDPLGNANYTHYFAPLGFLVKRWFK